MMLTHYYEFPPRHILVLLLLPHYSCVCVCESVCERNSSGINKGDWVVVWRCVNTHAERSHAGEGLPRSSSMMMMMMMSLWIYKSGKYVWWNRWGKIKQAGKSPLLWFAFISTTFACSRASHWNTIECAPFFPWMTYERISLLMREHQTRRTRIHRLSSLTRCFCHSWRTVFFMMKKKRVDNGTSQIPNVTTTGSGKIKSQYFIFDKRSFHFQREARINAYTPLSWDGNVLCCFQREQTAIIHPSLSHVEMEEKKVEILLTLPRHLCRLAFISILELQPNRKSGFPSLALHVMKTMMMITQDSMLCFVCREGVFFFSWYAPRYIRAMFAYKY